MKTVTVTRQADAFNMEEWSFYFLDDFRLVLDHYSSLRRESGRHKFGAVNTWERCSPRRNTLTASAVPMPEDVAEEAKQRIVNQIVVVRELSKMPLMSREEFVRKRKCE